MKKPNLLTIIFLAVCAFACSFAEATSTKEDMMPASTNIEYALFGAGCFWCVESEFQAIKGVIDVVSGYAGGHTENPTYEEVSSKDTGHIEVVRISYNPEIVDYKTLVDAFWLIHDPTQANGQGVDIGSQYISAILPLNEQQTKIAEQAKAAVDASGDFKKPIATIIKPAGTFYEAEGYHQDYYAKKGIVYDSVFELGGKSTTMKKRESWFKQMFGN